MTATTIPQGLGARSWNTILKVTAVVALIVVLTAGAFAFGRSTADEAAPAVPAPAAAASSYQDPALDLPPVSLHTGVQHFYVEPEAASCNHTANTPPC